MSRKRNRKIILLSFLVCNGLIILYIAQNTDERDSNISCHYVDEYDALPSAEDRNFLPRANSIFFHETSCRGGLNARQACAIESASRAHPRRQVYIMFSGPVSEVVFQGSFIAALRRFANIKCARVHIQDYARMTPLEDMVAFKLLNKSKWRVSHSSDFLRYLTLYKWGGVYLDTDMLIVRSLSLLGHNWVAKESNCSMSSAAIAISKDHLGRKFAEAFINEIKTTYKPDYWAYNGPGVVTRVLRKMCQISNMSEWSSDSCHEHGMVVPAVLTVSRDDRIKKNPYPESLTVITGRQKRVPYYPVGLPYNLGWQGLEVYNREYLNTIHFTRSDEFFKPGELKDAENAYAHHFWNHLSRDKKIQKDSPYAKLAQKYCPTIYKMYGKEFGT